jgi:hypothetical protein
MDVGELIPYANNAKEHPDWQVEQIAASIRQFGMCDPVGVWTNPDGGLEIVEGHGRVLALKEMGVTRCPVIKLDHLDDEGRRAYTHIHNQTNLTTGFDWEALDAEIAQMPEIDWSAFGFDVAVNQVEVETDASPKKSLLERFGFVPFSVIRGDSARWMERRDEWLAIGIKSELGRGEDLLTMSGCLTWQLAHK